MKTANRGFRNLSLLLLAVCLFVSLCVLVSCAEYSLYEFNKLEKKSLKNGTISAGAVRITDYNNSDLKKARQRLANDLYNLRAKFSGDTNLMPQSYVANTQMNSFLVRLAAGTGDFNLPQKSSDPAAYFQNFLNTFYDIMKNNKPELSDIELVGLRMATMKYIESELEDINSLNTVCRVDPNYRRVVISLDLAAWVTGDAKAALVYVDLYPYKADDWCYKTADNFRMRLKWKDSNDCNETTLWTNKLRLLEAFPDDCLKSLKPASEVNKFERIKSDGNLCDLSDLSALMTRFHHWLGDSDLLPRIVQVERINPGEYSVLAQAAYSGTELQMGGGLPTGLSGAIQAMSGKKREEMGAKVFPLNLAFMAGERRAGWLFMPSQTGLGRMPATERRLRLVVDIPKSMKKLGVYVHKAFLDSELHIIRDADFSNQMANLRKAHKKIIESDSWYKEEESRFYRLEKSRIRNLFYQGWSEEMVADIPPEVNSPEPKPPGRWSRFVKWFRDRIGKGLKT